MDGYEAVRRAASGDWGDYWDRAMDSLGGAGFPDSQMQLDTGHKMWVYHKGPHAKPGGLFGESSRPGFHVQVWHPAGDEGHVVEAHLGDTPEHVGPLLRDMFARRDVQQHLMGQMARAQGRGPDQTGNRLMIDMTGGR